MKTKVLIVLMAAALMLTISGTTQAASVTLPGVPFGGTQYCPFIWKTWNYEIGTNYFGGTAGEFYLRTAGTSYDTVEEGVIDNTHPNYGGTIAANLISVRDDSLKDDEDSWGLLRVTALYAGDITGNDSHFGDGSNANLYGNDITAAAGGAHWNEGDEINGHETYLRGMLWGSQDQVIECVSPGDYGPDMTPFTVDDVIGEYKIWASNGEYRIFEILDDTSENPAVHPDYQPSDRPVAEDEFDGWFDDTTDELMAGGTAGYFRYQGQLPVTEAFAGTTEVVFDVDTGVFADQIVNWWTHPEPDGTNFDIWQTWNIGNPFVTANGWTGSEDSARGVTIIPEPMTMLGVFLGVSSLTGYIRKRRMA